MSVSRRKFIGAGVAGAAAVTLGRNARAVADGSGARLVDSAYLYKKSERPAFPEFSCHRSGT